MLRTRAWPHCRRPSAVMTSQATASGQHTHPLLPTALQEEYRRTGLWEDTTLADLVRMWAERDPERMAIRGDTQLTYAQLWEAARRLAGSLRANGLAPGE